MRSSKFHITVGLVILGTFVGTTRGQLPVPPEPIDDPLPRSIRPVSQPNPTLPPITVRPQPLAPFAPPQAGPGPGYGMGSGGARGGAAFLGAGSIPWRSDAITSDRQLVGPYNQPVWTTQRPFAASRVYVLPAGQMQVEQWVRPTWPRNGKVEYRFLEEYAVGLPGRFQLDIYERWNVEPNANNVNTAHHEGNQIELRWAFADWGAIPLNPTLYAEWVQRGSEQADINKPNKYELKFLMADEVLPNLYYASNLIMEHEVGGEHELELSVSNAFSTTLIERKLLGGVEMLYSNTTVAGARGDGVNTFNIGPSMQFRPTNRTFFNVVGLFGTSGNASICQAYFIFGYQFGYRAGPPRGYIGGPASTSAN